MYGASIFSLIASSLSALFGIIGFVHLLGPRFLRDAYERWDYFPGLRVTTGVLEIVTAYLLAEPTLRGWGIALGAIITFAAVVTLLSHCKYLHALPGIVMMAALIPAALSIPRTSQQIHFYAPISSVLDTRQDPERVETPMRRGFIRL